MTAVESDRSHWGGLALPIVHLMLTCLCDAMFADVGRATTRVLEYAGCQVEFDPQQTCCGQPAFNAGDWPAARRVALHTLDVFHDAQAVVAPSASCAAMMRHGYGLLFEDHPRREQALALGRRTYELSEFLVRVLKVPCWPAQPARRIGLHPSCHLRQLEAWDLPGQLLQSIGGVDVVPFAEPEQCCGFGGVFSVKFPWMSRQMGESKLAAIEEQDLQEVVSTDMGCLMHLRGMAEKQKRPLRFTHIAQLLADSLT